MAGRKPKPTAVKKLEGNPGKRKLNSKEPVPAKGMPTCPDWLMPEAKKEWERLAELMNQMGVLTEVDMVSDGKLMETQTANYFSDIYPIDCAVLSANA